MLTQEEKRKRFTGYARTLRERRKAKGACPKCGKMIDIENSKQCRTCRTIGAKLTSARAQGERDLVFAYYGPNCACCGEAERHFLAIDHGPGSPPVKNNPTQRPNLAKWIIENNYPKGFRILCHNCNMATRFGRQCPHQKNKSS